MGIAAPTMFVMATFLLVTWSVFSGLLGMTTDQNDALREANELRAERLDTLVAISSTALSGDGHVASVLNRSDDVSFSDLSKLEVFARYLDASGDTFVKRLDYPTEWKVSAISPDTSGVSVWDPGETASIYFTLSPLPFSCVKGTMAVAVPGGISDSAYFDTDTACSYFWHNDPTPPTGDTVSHTVLTIDKSSSTETTLYNYDTDRDTAAGLLIQKGGTGPGEGDPLKHQVWRTGALGSAMAISGDVTIDFWAALKDFNQSASGEVTLYLRD